MDKINIFINYNLYLLFFIFSVILYLVSNLITESVFILRNAFPVLLMLSIFYLNSIKNNYINKKQK